MNTAYRTNAKLIVSSASRSTSRRLYPLRTVPVALAMSMGLAIAAITTDTGCGASQAQVAQTVLDGEQLAVCILGEVFGGITDPLVIAQKCAGALPAVIADVISNFETKQASAQADVADAGGSPPDADASATLVSMARRPLSDREKVLLDTAKKNAALLVASSQKR